jgi:hypothetical protein
MTDIKGAMKLIGGVEPTPQQVQRVQAIAHSLGIAQNDPMLSILIALDCYHGVFSDLPTKSKELAHTVALTASTQAKASVDKTVNETISRLEPEVQKAMGKVVAQVATRQMFQWAIAAIIIAGLALGLTFWYGHSTGIESGKAIGYADAKDEKAAAAWANTPQGQQAYWLAKVGSIDTLAKCSGKGWKIENGLCYPFPAGDQKVYPWKIY